MTPTPPDPFLNQLRQLVTSNRPEDVVTALEQLYAFTRDTSAEYARETLGHRARLNSLLRERRSGILTQDAAAACMARLTTNLLELIDEIERTLNRCLFPVPMTSVAFDPPPDTGLEKIWGANNLKNISWLRVGLERARSVCRIITPRGRGTGFLLDGGHLLTNHHVISDDHTAANSYAEFGYEEDASGKLLEATRYKVRSGIVCDKSLDFCLATLEPSSGLPPLESWGSLTLATGPAPVVEDHVTVIQHAGGGPKQIAMTANQVVNVFGHRLQYMTDTLPGSSGAPVFNDAWQVVALHHSGGNLTRNARGERIYANEGILSGALLERIGDRISQAG